MDMEVGAYGSCPAKTLPSKAYDTTPPCAETKATRVAAAEKMDRHFISNQMTETSTIGKMVTSVKNRSEVFPDQLVIQKNRMPLEVPAQVTALMCRSTGVHVTGDHIHIVQRTDNWSCIRCQHGLGCWR